MHRNKLHHMALKVKKLTVLVKQTGEHLISFLLGLPHKSKHGSNPI